MPYEGSNPSGVAKQGDMMLGNTKTVPLWQWEHGFFSSEYWEVYAYSEYGRDGIPKFAEIRRIN